MHFFWHGFDLAVTRFSGRPSGNASEDPVTREAYSHEVISFGFWAGDDNNIPDAAYYSYTAPEPKGLRGQALAVGAWMRSARPRPLPSSPTRRFGPRRIPAGCSSPSAGALTKQEPVSPAGIRPPSPRGGVPLSFSCKELQATAAVQLGLPVTLP
jgi:Family of unknown function (DUF5996)